MVTLRWCKCDQHKTLGKYLKHEAVKSVKELSLPKTSAYVQCDKPLTLIAASDWLIFRFASRDVSKTHTSRLKTTLCDYRPIIHNGVSSVSDTGILGKKFLGSTSADALSLSYKRLLQGELGIFFPSMPVSLIEETPSSFLHKA